MPGCGYICPKCNDTGLDENLKACDWCLVEEKISDVHESSKQISDEDWINSVHNGPCCGDLGTKHDNSIKVTISDPSKTINS